MYDKARNFSNVFEVIPNLAFFFSPINGRQYKCRLFFAERNYDQIITFYFLAVLISS